MVPREVVLPQDSPERSAHHRPLGHSFDPTTLSAAYHFVAAASEQKKGEEDREEHGLERFKPGEGDPTRRTRDQGHQRKRKQMQLDEVHRCPLTRYFRAP